MKTVNVHEAKAHLSRLLKRVEADEETVIARNGRAVARLVPVGGVARRPGAMKGRIRMRSDFDAPLQHRSRRPFVARPGEARHHEDPFDRLLVAQSQSEGLTLVTYDAAFRAYDVATLPSS